MRMSETGLRSAQTIRTAISLGLPVTGAVRLALGQTLTAWADGRWSIAEVSMCLRYHEGRVYDEIRAQLAADLQLPRSWLDRVIEAQASPQTPAA